MEVLKREISVETLVSTFNARLLIRNEEYQRGESWTLIQKATFVDSLFRGYPVPAIFLHRVVARGLDGDAPHHEIVDGQQRLSALRDFTNGKVRLLKIEDSDLRLPRSLHGIAAPWAGKVYQELEQHLIEKLNNTVIDVFEIANSTNPAEVRDLFIRLQSGSALSRQQIRDAWPGQLGPFIERLAGKLDRPPSQSLFQLIDKRGQRSDDEKELRDTYVSDRQTCAQLLRIFIAREQDPYAFPSVAAGDLDGLYQQYSEFDDRGLIAQRFSEILRVSAAIFRSAAELDGKRKVWRRLDVAAVMALLQQVTRQKGKRIDNAVVERIAKVLVKSADDETKPKGRTTSGVSFELSYEWWRQRLLEVIGIRLDVRQFDDDMKEQIFKRDGGLCGVCGKIVERPDAEYDHYPIAHRDGGETEVDNGRLVHKKCHPRGRPSDVALLST